MVIGRMSYPGGESMTPGTRGRPETILQTVRRFPHGECDVRSAFFRLADQHLRRWRGDCRLGSHDQSRIEDGLLNTNPWNPHLRPPMPQGYSEGLSGSTEVWMECWCLGSGCLGELFGSLFGEGPKRDPYRHQAFLEVSCLTWRYHLGDRETDLVIDLRDDWPSPKNPDVNGSGPWPSVWPKR